jgi:hypothetical protein
MRPRGLVQPHPLSNDRLDLAQRQQVEQFAQVFRVAFPSRRHTRLCGSSCP